MPATNKITDDERASLPEPEKLKSQPKNGPEIIFGEKIKILRDKFQALPEKLRAENMKLESELFVLQSKIKYPTARGKEIQKMMVELTREMIGLERRIKALQAEVEKLAQKEKEEAKEKAAAQEQARRQTVFKTARALRQKLFKELPGGLQDKFSIVDYDLKKVEDTSLDANYTVDLLEKELQRLEERARLLEEQAQVIREKPEELEDAMIEETIPVEDEGKLEVQIKFLAQYLRAPGTSAEKTQAIFGAFKNAPPSDRARLNEQLTNFSNLSPKKQAQAVERMYSLAQEINKRIERPSPTETAPAVIKTETIHPAGDDEVGDEVNDRDVVVVGHTKIDNTDEKSDVVDKSSEDPVVERELAPTATETVGQLAEKIKSLQVQIPQARTDFLLELLAKEKRGGWLAKARKYIPGNQSAADAGDARYSAALEKYQKLQVELVEANQDQAESLRVFLEGESRELSQSIREKFKTKENVVMKYWKKLGDMNLYNYATKKNAEVNAKIAAGEKVASWDAFWAREGKDLEASGAFKKGFAKFCSVRSGISMSLAGASLLELSVATAGSFIAARTGMAGVGGAVGGRGMADFFQDVVQGRGERAEVFASKAEAEQAFRQRLGLTEFIGPVDAKAAKVQDKLHKKLTKKVTGALTVEDLGKTPGEQLSALEQRIKATEAHAYVEGRDVEKDKNYERLLVLREKVRESMLQQNAEALGDNRSVIRPDTVPDALRYLELQKEQYNMLIEKMSSEKRWLWGKRLAAVTLGAAAGSFMYLRTLQKALLIGDKQGALSVFLKPRLVPGADGLMPALPKFKTEDLFFKPTYPPLPHVAGAGIEAPTSGKVNFSLDLSEPKTAAVSPEKIPLTASPNEPELAGLENPVTTLASSRTIDLPEFKVGDALFKPEYPSLPPAPAGIVISEDRPFGISLPHTGLRLATPTEGMPPVVSAPSEVAHPGGLSIESPPATGLPNQPPPAMGPLGRDSLSFRHENNLFFRPNFPPPPDTASPDSEFNPFRKVNMAAGSSEHQSGSPIVTGLEKPTEIPTVAVALPPELPPAIKAQIPSIEKVGLTQKAVNSIGQAEMQPAEAEKFAKVLTATAENKGAVQVLSQHLESGVSPSRLIENAMVQQKDGFNSVTGLIIKQVSVNPEHFGFTGDPANQQAVFKWAQKFAKGLATQEGFIKPDGTSVGLEFNPNKPTYVFLTDDGHGHYGIKLTDESTYLGKMEGAHLVKGAAKTAVAHDIEAPTKAPQILAESTRTEVHVSGVSGEMGPAKTPQASDSLTAPLESKPVGNAGTAGTMETKSVAAHRSSAAESAPIATASAIELGSEGPDFKRVMHFQDASGHDIKLLVENSGPKPSLKIAGEIGSHEDALKAAGINNSHELKISADANDSDYHWAVGQLGLEEKALQALKNAPNSAHKDQILKILKDAIAHRQNTLNDFFVNKPFASPAGDPVSDMRVNLENL